jgi:hypothetical protein
MTVAISLVALGVCLPFLPLMAARTSSFEEARSVCWKNLWATVLAKVGDAMDDEVEIAEELEFWKSNAANGANWFAYGFRTASSWFSLACFLVWVLSTPKTPLSVSGLALKRGLFSPPPPPPSNEMLKENCIVSTASSLVLFVLTVGSFYALQVLGNFSNIFLQGSWGCLEQSTGEHQRYLHSLFATFFGISILGTNVLCHSYLLEKAKAVSNM